MWSAYLRAPSPSALEALADAVQVADAVPIPPRAAFPPLLKALTAKSTHAAVVLRGVARQHPSAAARAGRVLRWSVVPTVPVCGTCTHTVAGTVAACLAVPATRHSTADKRDHLREVKAAGKKAYLARLREEGTR